MKTHDFARAPTHLARALGSCPNVELEDGAAAAAAFVGAAADSGSGPGPTPDSGLALSVRVGLSRHPETRREGLIAEWGLPADVRSHRPIRDIAGEVPSYPGRDPDAANKITGAPVKERAKASPELARVLAAMLGGRKANRQRAEGGNEKP